MPVVAAVEFNDLVSSGKRASEAKARHRRFGTAAYHAHLFDRWHPIADQLRHLHFQRVRNPEAQTACRRGAHGINDNLWPVPEKRRSPAADKIDVLVSIDIPNSRTLSASDKEWFGPNVAKRADRRVHAAGDMFLSAMEQF